MQWKADGKAGAYLKIAVLPETEVPDSGTVLIGSLIIVQANGYDSDKIMTCVTWAKLSGYEGMY